MRILSIVLIGSVALALGCGKDGGVIVETTGGGGPGGTTTTTTAGAGTGGAGATTTSTVEGGSGGTATGGTGGTTTGSGGTGGTTTGSGGTGGAGGIVDPVEDEDKDGWSIADGDCCDSTAAACSDKPWLVNPGALEAPGNQVDDDCNPATPDDQPYPTCSPAAQADMDIESQAVIGAVKLAKAMDLCLFTTENPPLPQKTWGIISAQYTLADGSQIDMPKNIQVGVLPSFGPNVTPKYGETMAAISSGTARREGDPGFVPPKTAAGQVGSFNAQTACSAPPSYLAASGGELPSSCATCMGQDCATAYDSVSLRLRLRPPTNAKGFSYWLDFYSSEYPEYVCQSYNDFFLALISGNLAPDIPQDGNVAFDSTGQQPISVNNALLEVCMPSPGYTCPGGTLELIGHGWGGPNGSITAGGATGWLKNVVPLALKPNPAEPGGPAIPTAEPLDLELVIWDSGDHNVDSLVLLDGFRWSLDPVMLVTHHE